MSISKTTEEIEKLEKEHSVRKYDNKDVVMKKLKRCKRQLLNDRTKTIKDLYMPLDAENALAVEFPTKILDAYDPPYVQEQREDMVVLIQDLMEQVKYRSDKILVVDVKTPAVDLDRNFSSSQLDFMRDVIFKGIKTELGTNVLSDETEKQWKDAFQAVTSIVDIEKQKTK